MTALPLLPFSGVVGELEWPQGLLPVVDVGGGVGRVVLGVVDGGQRALFTEVVLGESHGTHN